MTVIHLNFIVLAGAIVVFTIYALKSYRGIDSPKSFFYKEKLSANVISLIAANITLGTGVAYLVQGGRENGILMMFIPLMVCIGYYLLALFVQRYVASDILQGSNFIHAINEKISNHTGSLSSFSVLVTISLIVVYTLILPFEIFASSKIIAPLLAPGDSITLQIVLSLVIFIATLFYVVLGGIEAVFATDKLQLTAIIVFLIALVYVAFGALRFSEFDFNSVLETAFKFDKHIILNVVAACIAAISTQFYSLLNWGYISHLEAANHGKMLKSVGIFSALLLTLIVSLGVFYPAKEGSDIITDLMALFSRDETAPGVLMWIISGFAIFGMISIVFSTVDSLIIKITMFYYQNIAKRDSRSSIKNLKEIKLIRRLIFITFGIIFILLGYFNFIQPNVFYLLLAIVAGINIFAPMLATAGFLSCKGASLAVFKPSVVWGYFSLFLITAIISIFIFLTNPTYLGWIGTTAFIVSSIYSVFVILVALKPNS